MVCGWSYDGRWTSHRLFQDVSNKRGGEEDEACQPDSTLCLFTFFFHFFFFSFYSFSSVSCLPLLLWSTQRCKHRPTHKKTFESETPQSPLSPEVDIIFCSRIKCSLQQLFAGTSFADSFRTIKEAPCSAGGMTIKGLW